MSMSGPRWTAAALAAKCIFRGALGRRRFAQSTFLCSRNSQQTRRSLNDASSKPRQTKVPLDYLAPRPRTSPKAHRISAADELKLSAQHRRRRTYATITATFIFAVSAYAAWAYTSIQNTERSSSGRWASLPSDLSDRYSSPSSAAEYDSLIGLSEKLMRMGRLRKKIVSEAKGWVLESAVGTGRNAKWVEWRNVKSMLAVDKSEAMVAVGSKKFDESHAPAQRAKMHFLTADLSSPTLLSAEPPALPRPKQGFDTVIQTFALCSTGAPKTLLRNLAGLTNPSTGRILLLEHGKGHYAWLNDLLDRTAPAHADKHGCWWNRDIGQIIGEACVEDGGVGKDGEKGESQSVMEIVRIERYHLGTTWLIELKPCRKNDK